MKLPRQVHGRRFHARLLISALSCGAFLALSGCGGESPATDSLSVNQTKAALSEDDRYIIRFVNPGRAQATLKAHGAKPLLELPSVSGYAAQVPEQAVAAIARDPNVIEIEPDARRYPLAQEVPYGIPMIQADMVSDGSAANTTVCIIDSGINATHEDLNDNSITASPDGSTGDPLFDGCGHGTHVAGTIAAENNSLGVIGINPSTNLNIHIVKVFGNDCAWAYSSSLIQALDKCQTESPTTDRVVINMSLGGDRKSHSEQVAFDQAYATGKVLPVAAAGNAGNTRNSYPASYDGVVSVAAVDASGTVASFSQQNSQVELAAPGVDVLSTMMPGAEDYSPASDLSVNSTGYDSNAMAGSPDGSVSAALIDCGLGSSTCSAASGKVCLIARGGNIAFSDKVLACQNGGGSAAIIYNNEPGALLGTLGGVATTIPSVGISDTDGATLLGEIGQTASVIVDSSVPYTSLNGTSMATPHVAGAAALLWSNYSSLSSAEVRDALDATALDLGSTGRDNAYGYGLVQVFDAFSSLASSTCSTNADCDDGDACNGVETCVSGVCSGGTAPSCDDGNVCTSDSCDPTRGCQNTPLSAGTDCSDGDICNGAETCDGAGACTAGTPATAGTSCADGDLCNGDETCDGSGSCSAGIPFDCGAQICDSSLGCVDPPSCKASGEKCKGNSECCSGACYVGAGPPHCG